MRPRVMVIDDDRVVANAIRRTLEKECDVVVETDPRAALDRLREGDRFDVVLCDLAMPNLSGPKLHDDLSSTHPDVAGRIVFIAGGFGRDDLPAGLPNRRIGKPYQPEMLRQVVREVAATAGLE